MFDKFLEFGCHFDWIGPVAAWIKDIQMGPNYTFFVPYNESPYSGKEIAMMLEDKRIPTWGHMIVNDEIMITVRKYHAYPATEIFAERGVPCMNPAVRGKKRRWLWIPTHHYTVEVRPKRRTKRQGLTGKMTGFLSGIVDDFRL